MTVLRAQGLGKKYKRKWAATWALTGCTLDIEAGHVTGLVGPNGAGKSTLLNMAAGMLEPTTGTIEVCGGVPGSGPEQLAKVGFVAQNTPVYAGLTVEDHLRLGAHLNPGWDDTLARRRIHRIGLDLKQHAGKLSGGQRAQLALTLGIAKRPELLLLDVQDLMEAVAEHGLSVLLSSHLVSDLERVCDQLIVLVASQVRVEGDVEDLLATHHRLSGPRRDVDTLPSDQHVVSATLSASPAAADTVPYLPDPTGRQPVGVTSLYLKDTSRPDPWVPSVPYRELMVSVFYPAVSAHGPKKQFMTVPEAQALLDEDGITSVPAELVSATRTNAVVDARPAGRRLPLIVLSPGFKKMRATLSSLAEDLASHGNVVVVVDHTYENLATTFPDGRVTGCAACGNYDPEFWQKLQRGRATDVSFVLDELHTKWRGAKLIDWSRIGMAGHSVGGASTINAMLGDSRIRAGIDVDGTTSDPLLPPGLSRPFMFLGKQKTYVPGTGPEAESWEKDWAQLTGWKRWLVVAGMEHPSFTDVGLVGEQLGLDFGAYTPAARGTAITRAYVRAFFDLHLRGKPQPLLAEPSARYPEVTFIG